MTVEFSIDSDVLLPAVSLVFGAIEKKQDNPVLSHILFTVEENKLLLRATDLELECLACAEPAQVQQAGQIVVPAKKLMDISKALPDKTCVKFTYQDGKLLIKIGRSRFSISTMSESDFPLLEEHPNELQCRINREALLALLQSSAFSMAQQDVRYYLNGLLIETDQTNIRAVATDGHRLAISHLSVPELLPKKRVIVPRKAVTEFLRFLNGVDDEEVMLSLSSLHFQICSAYIQLSTKLIDGAFPNYQAAIPENNDKTVLVQRDDLKQSLSRVSVLANEKARSIKLTLKDNLVLFTARNQDKDEALDEIMVHTKGEECSIGFNVAYLMDALSNLPEGEVLISFSTPYNSILITSQFAPNCQYIIMPVKI